MQLTHFPLNKNVYIQNHKNNNHNNNSSNNDNYNNNNGNNNNYEAHITLYIETDERYFVFMYMYIPINTGMYVCMYVQRTTAWQQQRQTATAQHRGGPTLFVIVEIKQVTNEWRRQNITTNCVSKDGKEEKNENFIDKIHTHTHMYIHMHT